MNDREKQKAFGAELRTFKQQYFTTRNQALGQVDEVLAAGLVQIRAILAAAPSDYQSWILPQLESQIQIALRAVERQASEITSKAVQESWDNGILLIDTPLQAATVSVSAMLPAIDSRQLLAIQNFSIGKIAGITTEIANKINTQLGLVMMGVQPVGDAINVITSIMEQGDRARTLGIIRTELGRVNSLSSHLRKLQAAQYLPGMQKLWRQSGKLHPRETHVLADGQIRDVDKPFNIGGVDMMHPHDPKAPAKEVINCGCYSLPHMAHWTVKIPGKLPV